MQFNHSTIAVVTGAASGIGRSLAEHLDGLGCRLALCDVDEKGLADVAASLSRPPLVATVDVSNIDQVEAFAAEVHDKLGTANLVIANAGISYTGSMLSTSTEDFDRVFAINVHGVVHTVRSFLPPMVEAKSGAVVTISSVFGLVGMPNQSAYCAAKAAVKGFTESLDLEVRSEGIHVACVHPGAVATNIVRNGRLGQTVQGMNRKLAEKMIDRGVSPASAAQTIIDGASSGKRRILVGKDARLLDVLQRVFPTRYRDYLLYQAAKVGRRR